jgi:CHAT domain-containing protein
MSEYRHLYELIEDVFDKDGIRALCIDVKLETGVDLQYENLAGDTKRRKAQELQEFARRNQITPDLLQAIHRAMPRTDLTQFGGPEADLSKPVKPAAGDMAENSSDEPAETMVYDNFDITIRPTDKRHEYILSARSPQGETADSIRQVFPFEDAAYQKLARTLRDVQISTLENADKMGEILRHFLFPSKIQELFSISLNLARAGEKDGIRVRININKDSSELYQVPWEYCKDDRTFLALNDDTPLVRYMDTNRAPSSLAAPKTVKILLASATPKSLGELDVQSEIDAVKDALAAFTASGKVVIEELPKATPRSLLKAVRVSPPHIFHFMGHGKLNEDGSGGIVLEDGRMLDGDRLLRMFQGDDTKLIILSACKTGAMGDKTEKSSSAQAFMGLAPKLVWGGIPAVVAMQYDLPNEAAQPFMQVLYEFLALGKPLDSAIVEARLGLDLDFMDSPYWGIPVLFMRSPDGNIW